MKDPDRTENRVKSETVETPDRQDIDDTRSTNKHINTENIHYNTLATYLVVSGTSYSAYSLLRRTKLFDPEHASETNGVRY